MACLHGVLVLDEEFLERAKARLTRPAFSAAAARLRAEVTEDLARPVLVPARDRPAGYYHDYFCPEHGVQLEFDWDSPLAHRCPVDGAAYRGEPYDRSWWWFVNHTNSEAGFRLALGWRLRGDAACLDRLGRILGTYAAHYPEAGWPKDDPRGRQGKVAYHALDEAAWLIPLVWAYDIARLALPVETRRDTEERLLAPAAEHLLAQRWPQVHNYMCWLNAGVASAATLLGRTDLLTKVLDGPYGFRQQAAEGVLGDGTWWEGSASYHFYTLAALLAHVRSTGQEGAQRELRRMFVAPLRWAYPDLSLPAINDCWFHSSLMGEVGHGIPSAAAFYETATGWYGDAAFSTVLAANYGGGRPRDSLEALLFGPEHVPAAVPDASVARRAPRVLTASVNLPELGVAVLRGPARRRHAGPDGRTFVLLKYGRHGGGHGHPDKLGIIVAGAGARFSPDLGTPGYGIALNGSWYRHTLSHNTVLIDGAPQPAATGRLLRLVEPRWNGNGDGGRRGAFGVIDAAVEWPADAHDAALGVATPRETTGNADVYDGVRMRRLVLMRRDYFVDVFVVSCPEEREIEWAYHNFGKLMKLEESGEGRGGEEVGKVATPEVPDPLRVTRVLHGDVDMVASFATGDASLDLWLAASRTGDGARDKLAHGTRVIVADAPANPASETMPLLLRRRRARCATFAAVFHPHGGRAEVRGVSWSGDHETLKCEVARARLTDRWEIPLREGAEARLTSRAARAVSDSVME